MNVGNLYRVATQLGECGAWLLPISRRAATGTAIILVPTKMPSRLANSSSRVSGEIFVAHNIKSDQSQRDAIGESRRIDL